MQILSYRSEKIMNQRLEKIFAELARARNQTLFARAVLGTCALGSAILVILMLLALTAKTGHGSAALAILFWIFSAAGFLGLAIWLKKNWLDLEKTALLAGRKFPELSDSLLNLVQLGKMWLAGKADFSPTLFERHLDQVEKKVAGIELGELAGLYRLKIPATIFAGIFCIWLVMLASVPGYPAAVKSALALKSLRRASPGQALKVSRPLELYDFSISCQYPAYSGLEPKRIEGSDGSINALKGTVVRLKAKTPVKVKKAWLLFSPAGKLEAVVNGMELSAAMVILDSGQYRIEAVDQEGKSWSEPRFHQLNASPDNPPEVNLLEPDKDLVVGLDQQITIKFQARDDFGLKSFALVFTSRGQEKKVPVKDLEPAALDASGQYQWGLAEYNLLPGEKVPYYIEARDNNDVTGPGLGKSQVRYLEVFSPLKRHQEIIAREQELFEALLSLLGQNIEARLAKTTIEKYWQDESALLKNFQELKSRVDALKNLVAEDDYSPELVRDALASSSGQYGRMLTARRNSLAAKNQELTTALREQAIPRFERDLLFWDLQLKKQRMDFLLALGDQLKQQEDQLRRLIEQYKQSGNQDLLPEIEARLEQLKASYQDFLAQIAELDQARVDEFVNLDALEKQGAGEVLARLEQFRQSLHDRDLNNALNHAEDFLAGLDAMLGDLQKGSEQMGQAISAELMAQLQAGLSELKSIREAQQKLISRTEPVYQGQMQSREQADAAMEKELDDLQNRLEELADNWQDQFDSLNQMQFDSARGQEHAQEFYQARSRLSSQLWQMQQQMQNAAQDLERKSFEEAGREIQNLKNQLERLMPEAGRLASLSRGGSQNADSFAARAGRNLSRIKSLQEKISALEKYQAGKLTAQDLASLKKLGQEQGALRERLAAIENQFAELSRKLPFFPEELTRNLAQAELKMKDAQGELELNNPELALMAQKEAKHWLEQAEKQLEQLKKKCQQGSRPGGTGAYMPLAGSSRPGPQNQAGQGARTEDIKIPGPEANKDPVEMRKQILKAMREGSPKDYEQLLRDYYKRLVQ